MIPYKIMTLPHFFFGQQVLTVGVEIMYLFADTEVSSREEPWWQEPGRSPTAINGNPTSSSSANEFSRYD